MALLFLTGAVSISQPLVSPISIIYLFATVGAVAVAGWMGERSSRWAGLRPLPLADWDRTSHLDRYAVYMAAFSIVAILSISLDIRLSGQSGAVGDLYQSREMLLEGRTSTIFVYLYSATLPFALLGPAFVVLRYERLRTVSRLLAFVVPLLTTIWGGILVAGRYYIAAQIMLLFWAGLHRKVFGLSYIPRGFHLRIIIVSVLTMFSIGMGVIAFQRSAREDQIGFALELSSPLVTLHPVIVDGLNSLGPTLGAGAVDSLTYWTMSVTTFDKVYANWNEPLDLCRAFSPVLYRRLAGLGIVPSERSQQFVWEDIANQFDFYKGTWASAAFDLIKSFGKAGGLMAACLLGFIGGRSYQRSVVTGSATALAASALLWLFFFFWFQRSILIEPVFEYSAIFLVGTFIFSHFKKQRGRKRPSNGITYAVPTR